MPGRGIKVLITGGDGFIGSHLADELTEKGGDVALFDLKFGDNTKHLDCVKIIGDVRDYEDVKNAVKGKDVIFHLAAISRVIHGQQDPVNCLLTNTFGTLNVLEAIKKSSPHAVLFMGSSREVYGEPEEFPVSELHPKKPVSIYGISKLAAENLCLSYRKHFGIKPVILRFSNVYGSERDLLDRVIPKFILSALKNLPLTLYGGDQVLDFTHLDDTCQGILKAYEKALNGDIIGEDFQFVTGEGTSIKTLAQKIIRICNSSSKILFESEKGFDVKKFIGSFEKSNTLLHYKPKIKLEDGLRKTSKRLKAYIQEKSAMCASSTLKTPFFTNAEFYPSDHSADIVDKLS